MIGLVMKPYSVSSNCRLELIEQSAGEVFLFLDSGREGRAVDEVGEEKRT